MDEQPKSLVPPTPALPNTVTPKEAEKAANRALLWRGYWTTGGTFVFMVGCLVIGACFDSDGVGMIAIVLLPVVAVLYFIASFILVRGKYYPFAYGILWMLLTINVLLVLSYIVSIAATSMYRLH